MIANRLDLPPVKPKSAKSRQTKPSPQPAKTTQDNLRSWALAGVILTLALSAALNGYANSLHAEIVWAGWGMGIVIPAIVAILAKVAGLLWKRGDNPLAYSIAAVGTGLLFLSVWHCATSISLLTGSSLWLALPMAVAIDCGLVGCEVAHLKA